MIQQLFSATDQNNLPLSGGLLFTYINGTEIEVLTYSWSGNNLITNPWPYILDQYGSVGNNLYFNVGTPNLTVNLKDNTGAQLPDYPLTNVIPGFIQFLTKA